jgi:hypothetical protein
VGGLIARRAAFAALFAPFARGAGSRVPTDLDRMNRFAAEYNRYAEEFQRGIVDVKQWEKVRKAWREVNGE